MANIQLVNRYKQLLAGVPKGSFYDADGQVVPYRSGPYQLRITTNLPNEPMVVFVNSQFSGNIVTDISGMAIVTVQLQKGRNDVQLIDSNSQQVTNVYLTTRDSATLQASEAQVIESIDTGIEQVLLDARLTTSSAGLIETVFGQTVATGNSFGYDLDTYRELLQELRTAYRYFGASIDGMDRVVRAFTQISPLIYPRNFGPQWVLGKDIISPKQDPSSRTYYTTSTLSNVNVSSAGVSVTTISATVGVGTGILKCYGTSNPKTLSWTPPNGAEGLQVQITANGTYTLYGSDYFDPIIGQQGPFNIVTGANDQLELEIDGRGRLQLTLPAGGSVTAATIASTINSAFNSDTRYGAAYNSVASSYDLFASGFPQVSLTTPNGASGGSVIIYAAPLADAAQTIFNVPTNRGGFSSAISPTVIQLTANTNMNVWPTSVSSTNPFKVLIGYTLFHPTAPSSPSSPAPILKTELVNVIGVDHTLKQLTLASPGLLGGPSLPLILPSNPYQHSPNELVVVDADLSYKRQNVQKSRSITVNVAAFTLLPGSVTTDNVVVGGTGAPDQWIVTTNSGTSAPTMPLLLNPGAPGIPVTATAFSKHTYFQIDRDLPFDLNNNGMVTIPVPNEVLKYQGFPINVSVWGRIDDPSRPAPQEDISTIGLSFDNQSTYTYFTPLKQGLGVNATWRPFEYLVQTAMPTNATRMWIQVKTASGANGNFTIHKVRVTIPSHSGLFLGSGTIPRNETKIKQGSFLYVWSVNPLSSFEESSIGTASVTNVVPGHLDEIAPAQAWLDKFDVSQYDISNNPLNIVGTFTDANFLNGTSTNLGLTLRTPARFTHLDPTVVSQQVQTITWSVSSPFTATLNVVCDQNLAKAYLLENGVPVLQNQWKFLSPNVIQLLYTPLSGAVYTFTYNALIQFVSQVLDLSSGFANYLWFADYHVLLRPEIVPQLVDISAGIQFNTVGVATLDERSNGDQTTASLIENTGLSTRIIPPNQWNFVNNQSIQISLGIFNPGSIYSLNYTAEVNHPSIAAQALVEVRSSNSFLTIANAAYQPVLQNTPVGNQNEFYQFRVTLNNIRDIRDARIQSVLLKGLNLFGVGGTVPVLREP